MKAGLAILVAAFSIVSLLPAAFAADCAPAIPVFSKAPEPGPVPPFPGDDLSARILDKHLFDLENYRVGELESYNIRWKAHGDELQLFDAGILRLAQQGTCSFDQLS